jgi:hypothetical protein
MAYILDAAGYVTGTYDGPGQAANSTTISPPANAAHPLRFVDGAWLVQDAPARHITFRAMLERFTAVERAQVRALETRDMGVADFLMLARAASFIDLDDGTTQMGVAYLVSIKAITTDRAAAILGAEVTEAERP